MPLLRSQKPSLNLISRAEGGERGEEGAGKLYSLLGRGWWPSRTGRGRGGGGTGNMSYGTRGPEACRGIIVATEDRRAIRADGLRCAFHMTAEPQRQPPPSPARPATYRRHINSCSAVCSSSSPMLISLTTECDHDRLRHTKVQRERPH